MPHRQSLISEYFRWQRIIWLNDTLPHKLAASGYGFHVAAIMLAEAAMASVPWDRYWK